jgi:hypothetical protein
MEQFPEKKRPCAGANLCTIMYSCLKKEVTVMAKTTRANENSFLVLKKKINFPQFPAGIFLIF